MSASVLWLRGGLRDAGLRAAMLHAASSLLLAAARQRTGRRARRPALGRAR